MDKEFLARHEKHLDRKLEREIRNQSVLEFGIRGTELFRILNEKYGENHELLCPEDIDWNIIERLAAGDTGALSDILADEAPVPIIMRVIVAEMIKGNPKVSPYKLQVERIEKQPTYDQFTRRVGVYLVYKLGGLERGKNTSAVELTAKIIPDAQKSTIYKWWNEFKEHAVEYKEGLSIPLEIAVQAHEYAKDAINNGMLSDGEIKIVKKSLHRN